MAKRDYLKMTDMTLAEAHRVLRLAARLKEEPKGRRTGLLAGRAVAVVLEKASTRTRVSFEVGIAQLGAQPVVLSTQGSQLARGEPIRDTARVLERYCDLIAFRTSSTARLHEMAQANVPVINALSDEGHPVQVLSDVFTIEEALAASGDRSGIAGRRVAFIGDCASNMGRSWLEAAQLFDFHLVLAAPEGYLPPTDEIERARATGHVTIAGDPREGAEKADVVNTDVWASMGNEDEADKRRKAFAGWTVNAGVMEKAAKHAVVLHCLPAHRGEEIDEETLEGPRSRVWDQAENRLHVQKALMLWLLGVELA
ncbi:ornithine carbamoyltransferase [Sorangium cellulosum]|uniref:Ornithine carbamoyltransferase n=1 Tax=Sorangium cellulosum TaxID=56 RepID=A0A2L0F638_SORCE|nr:ornithine carbamoyltransferase [Sorangium cellulosum]AUX46992.1 ornithine carbamoyltransferase [Sorangium cellulosum]